MENNDRYLSVKETADMLNISVNYLAKLRSEKYNKDKDGNRSKFYIPYLQIGTAIRYKYSDLQEWIAKHTCA